MSHTRSKLAICDQLGKCVYVEILGASRSARTSDFFRLLLKRGGKNCPGSGSREVEERSIFILPCLGNPSADEFYPAKIQEIIDANPIVVGGCFRNVKVVHPISIDDYGTFLMSCEAAEQIKLQLKFVPNSFDGLGGVLNVPDLQVTDIIRKGTAIFEFIKDDLFTTWKIISDIEFSNVVSTYVTDILIKMTVFDRTDPARISETFDFEFKITNPTSDVFRMELESGTLPAIIDPEIRLEIFIKNPISGDLEFYEEQSFIPTIIIDFPPGEGPPAPEPEPIPLPEEFPGDEPMPEPDPVIPPIVVTPKSNLVRNVVIAGGVVAAIGAAAFVTR